MRGKEHANETCTQEHVRRAPANSIQAERAHLKETETDKEMKQLEGHGHGELTPDKALSKGKAETDRESSRQKFDTSLQCDLAKRHIKKE